VLTTLVELHGRFPFDELVAHCACYGIADAIARRAIRELA
jgi:hypothetical protein